MFKGSQLASRSPSFFPLGTMNSYKCFLSQLVKALCLSGIIIEGPFPSLGTPTPPVWFPLVTFRTPEISVRLLQKPHFSARSQGLSPPSELFCLWCSGHQAILSNRAQDAALTGETCLPFPSSLLYEVLC